jgi:hypothetical protein
MGSNTFTNSGTCKSADEVFKTLVHEAKYEHGHGGYTGSIAEKTHFIMRSVPANKDPYDYIRDELDNPKSPVDDKWGPAGCIAVKLENGKTKYIFYGWASC